MPGVYSVEDLLKLRASPLICKPPNLPAIEEIITAQETSTKRPAARSKLDDGSSQGEGFQKRPLLDSQQKKSATDPERIVLGPPRRSFASSSARVAGKLTQDGAEDTVSTREGSVIHDRFRSSGTSESKHHDRRHTNEANGRFGNRPDRDALQSERPRRRHDEEDGEARPRRDYDRERPKWASRDDQHAIEEEKHDESVRPGAKRDTQSRAKFDQPWFRQDKGGESLDDSKRDGERQEWRRDRGRDREWDRSARVEADPEWMDAPEQEEPTQVHTQEEFQRWKEKMKAAGGGGGGGAPDSKPDPGTPSSPDRNEEKAVKPRVIPSDADDSMDKFLARFNEAKITSEANTAPSKPPTKTRFASLFSPPQENPLGQLPSPPPPPTAAALVEPPVRERSAPNTTGTPSNTDADQAGFARILEMLQTRNSNPTPSTHEPKTKTPLYAREGQSRPDAERPPPPPPGLMSLFGQNDSPQSPSTRSRSPTGLSRTSDGRIPSEGSHARQQSNKDEFLLNLLRQANLAPKPNPMQHHQDQRPPPGMFGMPEASNRAAMTRNQMVSPNQGLEPTMIQRRETGRSMFEELPVSSMRYQDEPGHHEPLARRPTNGAPPPFFDDPYLGALRQGPPPLPQQKQQQQPPGPPPGLGRPPGFDHMPRMPPGWPAQHPPLPTQLQQQQQLRQNASAPNMGNHLHNMPLQYGAPNMPPQQLPAQSQRAPQRQYTGDSGMTSNFPLGMGPPPGFMGNGPPPGFSGAPPSYGRFQGAGEQPQGVGRAFMEMYGDGGRMGLRGGSNDGGMPGYK